jgi:ribosomal protein L15
MFPTSIVPQNQGQLKIGNKTFNLPQSVLTPEAAKNQKKAIAAQTNKTPTLKQDPAYQDRIMTGGQGTQQADLGFMQRLANMSGVDFDKAAATWKDKGGFEGLMSNPAFTMGLAFMAAGAEGKSIGQSSLNSILKAGGISQQYKKIIADRKQAPIQATAADIAETKDLLSKVGISEGNWFENFGSRIKNFFGKGGSKNPGLDYDRAVEEISVQYQAAVLKKQNELKAAGKSQILRIDDKLKIMEDLIASGKIQKNESLLSKLGITDATIQKREHGGPVQAGKPYVVGEAGPEVIIPKSDGNVLANDDSQIYAMLLAANPQLQKVSKQRAEKILRARFPEYFEG